MNRKNLQRTLDEALALHRAGDHAKAAGLYAKVCQAFPKLFDGWYLAGALALHDGRLEDAVNLLSKAQRLAPHSSECRLFLGMALADLGRHAEAVKPLRSALEKHPNKPEAWENLATSLAALGQPAEAVECLERALALQPDHPEWRERIDSLRLQAMLATVAR